MTLDPKVVKCDRESLRGKLEEKQIETRPVWKPLHLQPLFGNCESIGKEVAEELFERGLCLPSGSNLCEEDLQRVVKEIQNVLV